MKIYFFTGYPSWATHWKIEVNADEHPFIEEQLEAMCEDLI